MSVNVSCKQCGYCKTGEEHYCENKRIVKVPYTTICGRCCYCRTGETQYCENPVRYERAPNTRDVKDQ